MFQNDVQACRAIRVMLSGCFAGRRLERIWSEDGPEDEALAVLEKRSPMSRGEKTLVRIAFDFWNGEGKATIADTLNLDGRNLDAVTALMRAYNAGGAAVDSYICEATT